MLRKGDKRDAILNLLKQAKFYMNTGHTKTSLYYLQEAEHQVKLWQPKTQGAYLSKG
ncbi:hypothetical protein ABEO98_21665 [Brevibacillus parabrevis]|jgi:hypothetical protein|uniref:hypothetical protein n=1 Tax=Brevibacillus parabrevis TaxID=54914 RepID=UPI002E1B56CA|nr:hypothetical protein [Brevibacillus parabrevis]